MGHPSGPKGPCDLRTCACAMRRLALDTDRNLKSEAARLGRRDVGYNFT